LIIKYINASAEIDGKEALIHLDDEDEFWV